MTCLTTSLFGEVTSGCNPADQTHPVWLSDCYIKHLKRSGWAVSFKPQYILFLTNFSLSENTKLQDHNGRNHKHHMVEFFCFCFSPPTCLRYHCKFYSSFQPWCGGFFTTSLCDKCFYAVVFTLRKTLKIPTVHIFSLLLCYWLATIFCHCLGWILWHIHTHLDHLSEWWKATLCLPWLSPCLSLFWSSFCLYNFCII